MTTDKPATPRKHVRGRTLPYLQAWRMLHYLRQEDLASLSGLSRAAITRAERGDMVVNFANILRIAKALGVTPEDLQHAPSSFDNSSAG